MPIKNRTCWNPDHKAPPTFWVQPTINTWQKWFWSSQLGWKPVQWKGKLSGMPVFGGFVQEPFCYLLFHFVLHALSSHQELQSLGSGAFQEIIVIVKLCTPARPLFVAVKLKSLCWWFEQGREAEGSEQQREAESVIKSPDAGSAKRRADSKHAPAQYQC